MDVLNNMHSKSAGFPEFRKKLDEIKASMEEQKGKGKDSGKGKWDKKTYKEVKKAITTTRDSIEDFKSGDRLKILKGCLAIASSLLNLYAPDKSFGVIFRKLSEAVSVLITESKPNQPSVVHELIKVFQDQKYGGLKLRMSEQIFQF